MLHNAVDRDLGTGIAERRARYHTHVVSPPPQSERLLPQDTLGASDHPCGRHFCEQQHTHGRLQQGLIQLTLPELKDQQGVDLIGEVSRPGLVLVHQPAHVLRSDIAASPHRLVGQQVADHLP